MKISSIGWGLALGLATSVVLAAEPAPKATPATTAAPAGQAPMAPDLVVWQGDARLTLTDVDARMSRIPPDKRAGFINDPERIEQMLRGMLLTRQIGSEAEREGMLKDPVVAAEVRLATDEILARRKLSLHMRDLAVPDFKALAKERYISSPKLYSSQPSLDVRHILIDVKKHGDAEAKALAEKLRGQLLAGELEFERAARLHSDESGAKDDGGLIEDLLPGATLADFDTAAFALKKPGDISPVVLTKFGYHLIKLEQRTEAERYPFEKVQAQIEAELRQEFINRSSQEYLDRYRGNKLDANPDLVQSLRTRYGPDAPGTRAIGRTQGDVATPEGEAAAAASPPAPPQR